ncbi:MAG TPA: ABC transporter substrate-binding protein [Acidimicrobiales bacterium]|nr:ABC transporter substrate-binding protein [Acidimicrobiales bacterium]
MAVGGRLGRRRARRLVIAASLAGGLALVPALAAGATGRPHRPAVSIVIGYENNGADPSMITIANHYFQHELGPNVHLDLFSSGPAALSALASGALKFMCGLGLPPVISAIERGVPLVVVWNQERYTRDAGIVVRASTGIKSLAGLRGKTIALVTGSESSFELPTLLAQKGVPLSAVHQLNMSPPQMQSAWATGQINAAAVWDPVFDYLASHGGRILATDASLPPSASSFNICVANRPFVTSDPAAATAFARAMALGVNYMHSHPAKALAIMATSAGITTQVARKELAGYEIYSLADQVTQKVLGSGARVRSAGTTISFVNNWKELYRQGFITSPPPSPAKMARYIDPLPAARALR